jgi:hypothetical protein
MPKYKKKITCINHPEKRLRKNERPTVLHPLELVDGAPSAMAKRGIFLVPYICVECGYVELYAIDKADAVRQLQALEE